MGEGIERSNRKSIVEDKQMQKGVGRKSKCNQTSKVHIAFISKGKGWNEKSKRHRWEHEYICTFFFLNKDCISLSNFCLGLFWSRIELLPTVAQSCGGEGSAK